MPETLIPQGRSPFYLFSEEKHPLGSRRGRKRNSSISLGGGGGGEEKKKKGTRSPSPARKREKEPARLLLGGRHPTFGRG